jgi:SAM-dependent methyltransferase
MITRRSFQGIVSVMKDFWNNRFADDGFAYGTQPNRFLQSHQRLLKPGLKALLPGDGEGRNGVWLASLGLEVTSVDYSEVGIAKINRLADERQLTINTRCADLTSMDWPVDEFDLLVAIFIHFPSNIRNDMHHKFIGALKPGGQLIFEAYDKQQLDYGTGGPPVEDMLYTEEQLNEDFKDHNILHSEHLITDIHEGKYHDGRSSVLRFVVEKNT